MKICKDCNIVKPLTEFYKHKGMADGFLNNCKDCKIVYQSKYRVENIEEVREYDIARSKTIKRKLHIQKVADRSNKNHPEKFLARRAVRNEIRSGRLVKKPCAICSDFNWVHAHHEDYSKPLEIIWLCPAHHSERHKQIDNNINPWNF